MYWNREEPCVDKFKCGMNLNKSCIEMTLTEILQDMNLRWTLTRVVLKYSSWNIRSLENDRMNLNKSCIEIFLILWINLHHLWWTLTRVVLKYNFNYRINYFIHGWTLTRVVLKWCSIICLLLVILGWTLTRVVLKYCKL